MSSMLTAFEELTRAYGKALPVISKEESGSTPRFYLRCLVEMEDFIAEVWDDKNGRYIQVVIKIFCNFINCFLLFF